MNRKIDGIIQRNIFCSTCTASSSSTSLETDNSLLPQKSLVESQHLKLIATLIAPQKPEIILATIASGEPQEVHLYQEGSMLPEGSIVEDIEEKEVVLRVGEQEEILKFVSNEKRKQVKNRIPKQENPIRRRRLRQLNGINEFAKGIRQVNPHRWEIQRKALNKVLSNTMLIARSARIAPILKNGKPAGIRIVRIRPGAFYSLLGFKDGDVIHAVNGLRVGAPDQVLKIYTQVRMANHITINYTRNGRPLSHTYIIR